MAVGVGRGVVRALGSPFLCPTPYGISNTRQMFSSVCYPRKKESSLSSVNQHRLALFNPDEVEVVIRSAEEAEVDEMWSFVRRKKAPRWRWHAIDHRSGKGLASGFGRRQDEVFVKLKALLEPFGITQ